MEELLAPAKLNLTLRILGPRPDGFHELESLVVLLEWGDDVAVSTTAQVGWECATSNPAIPTDNRNLAVRAAERWAAQTGYRGGGRIELCKRIPVGSGLGGGSSDAAATLRLLNRPPRPALGREALVTTAAELGSDVPLFLSPPAAIIRGRGEDVTVLRVDWSGWWAVLLLSGVDCSTADVYRRYATDAPDPAGAPPDLGRIQRCLTAGEDCVHLFHNDLARAAFALRPELAELARRAADLLGRPVHVTGSGSALFTLIKDAPRAAAVARDAESRLGVATVAARLLAVEAAGESGS